jgi:hypothetical protein
MLPELRQLLYSMLDTPSAVMLAQTCKCLKRELCDRIWIPKKWRDWPELYRREMILKMIDLGVNKWPAIHTVWWQVRYVRGLHDYWRLLSFLPIPELRHRRAGAMVTSSGHMRFALLARGIMYTDEDARAILFRILEGRAACRSAKKTPLVENTHD